MLIIHETNMLISAKNKFNTQKCGCHHNETHVFEYIVVSTSKECDDEQWHADQEGAPVRATPRLPNML